MSWEYFDTWPVLRQMAKYAEPTTDIREALIRGMAMVEKYPRPLLATYLPVTREQRQALLFPRERTRKNKRRTRWGHQRA